LKKIRLLLDWTMDAKHAIFSDAMRRGCYAERGLELELLEPASKSSDAIQLIATEQAEIAINYPHNILLLRPPGTDIVSVGALVKSNPEGLLSLSDTGIGKPSDLKGKRIGIGPSPVSRAQFTAFLSENRLSPRDVDIVTVGFEGERLLIGGDIDVLDAVEYANSRTRRKGYEINFLAYSQFGIPDSPFLVFAASGRWVEENGEAVRGFLAASAEGLAGVKRWGSEEWGSYVAEMQNRVVEEEMEIWENILPLIEGQGPLFAHAIATLKGLREILRNKAILTHEVVIESIFLNTFLPSTTP
jgi:putative hydroxymethylpyrimidine transport system substrate-binding protein